MIDITIATPTVGNSEQRLRAMIPQLRRFAGVDFKLVVSSDDIVIPENEDRVKRQCLACMDNGVVFTKNPEPDPGRNLNHIMMVTSGDWVAFIEDGVLPSDQWLAVMVDYLSGIDDLVFAGPLGTVRIGMVSWPHVEGKFLAPFYDIPSSVSPLEWIRKCAAPTEFNADLYQQIIDDFYANGASWNKGDVTLGKIDAWCKTWHAGLWKDYGAGAEITLEGGGEVDAMPKGKGPRTPVFSMFPGGLIAVRREAWERVRGFVPELIYYEGGLGAKMRASGKWISVMIPAPPFIHMRGAGIRDVHQQLREKKDKRTWRGAEEVFEEISGHEYAAATPECPFSKWMSAFLDQDLYRQVSETSRFIADHIERQFNDG